MKKSFADILRSIDNDRTRKIASKLPSWTAKEGLLIPSQLSLEQCSSEAAARYKAALVASHSKSKPKLADLTGGLGIDSLAFSEVCSEVLYNEENPVLAEAAAHNFNLLGRKNISVISNSAESIVCSLGAFDWIYIDPARRDSAGRKVFLLEDCSPDVTALIPQLWEHTERIMLKLSPMADISMVASRLGNCLKEIHVTGLDGECKELVCILLKGNTEPFTTTVAELEHGALTFTERRAIDIAEDILPGEILFEPSAALVKSGYADSFCSQAGFRKLDRFTQLYASADEATGAVDGFGKTFKIVEVAGFNGSSIRQIGKTYPDADVTARNIPLSSEELRRKLGSGSGNGIHIFGTSVNATRRLIVCRKLSLSSQKVPGPEVVV